MRYTRAYFNLDHLLKEKGMSKTYLSYNAQITHTQINKMCKNVCSRVDLDTITRVCSVLECDISDLIILEPEKE